MVAYLVRVARSVVALLASMVSTFPKASRIGLLGVANCLGRRLLVLWCREWWVLLVVVPVSRVVVSVPRVRVLVALVLRPVVLIRVRAGVA